MVSDGIAAGLRHQARRRWTLWAAAVAGGLPLAVAAPAGDDRVVASSAVSVAFFATILTGEAVIFAIAFSASSSWPSLREIDAHIAFREWVVVGWLAAMLLGAGLLADVRVASTCGALLFLVADLFGIFSFVRLFGLASAGGRRRLLSRTLEAQLLSERASAAKMVERVGTDEVFIAFLRELDGSIAGGDGNGVRDLVEELASTTAAAGAPRAGLHLEVLHRLVRAVLTGRLDPAAGTACGQRLVDSLLAQIRAIGDRGQRRGGLGAGIEGRPGADMDEAGALAGHLARYLAWVGATAHVLAVRQVTTPAAARELVAFGVRARDEITFTVDPDPPYAASADALGSPLDSPLSVLAWIRQYVEFHGSSQANALYPVFELLTGTKFHGNYWDGASVLTALRTALYGDPRHRVGTVAADRTRAVFGGASGFDRFWVLVSVGAISTLRDTRLPHPPELIRPEFTPDPRLLRAYLRSWATHRYFTNADGAWATLFALIGNTEDPDGPWARTTALLGQMAYPVPLPAVEPRRRAAAAVLAIALRLAPLDGADGADQLSVFLRGLPAPALDGVHRLAERILPGPEPETGPAAQTDPIQDLVGRLNIVRMPTVLPVPRARTASR